jgi:hypothetical protein
MKIKLEKTIKKEYVRLKIVELFYLLIIAKTFVRFARLNVLFKDLPLGAGMKMSSEMTGLSNGIG